MSIPDRLREIADDIEIAKQCESTLRYDLERAQKTIKVLTRENHGLRAAAGETELDPRDARIAQLEKEQKRLNALLNDAHRFLASPSAVSYEGKAQREVRDDYIRAGSPQY